MCDFAMSELEQINVLIRLFLREYRELKLYADSGWIGIYSLDAPSAP